VVGGHHPLSHVKHFKTYAPAVLEMVLDACPVLFLKQEVVLFLGFLVADILVSKSGV
jgi:hypothetical protein